MTLMSWLSEKLHRKAEPDKYAEAVHATEEFTTKVRSLRQQLQPYALEDDPFAAILTAHDSAASYQEEQDRMIVIIEEPPRE